MDSFITSLAQPDSVQKSTENQKNHSMDLHLEALHSRLCGLKMNQTQTNAVYEICISLVKNINEFNCFLIDSANGMDPIQALQASELFICNKLNECSTRWKRKKKLQTDDLYVPPKEHSIGIRWNMSKHNAMTPMIPRLIPNKYECISITDTIISLFRREDFRQEYFMHNESNQESCEKEVYTSFCSGKVFKSNELFRHYPDSLQIVIATDDFEVCNALGSKATLHKLCPIYFAINNIPIKFKSKLDTIHVASLCYTDDLKTKYTDFNDVWRPIVKDISRFEEGIDIGDGRIIRGTVVIFSSDNLGANTALGLVPNFSKAYFFCRFCLCSRDEIKFLSKEIPEKRRNKQEYEEQIANISDSAKIDLKETKGVVRYCVLNDLKYYHMLDNMTSDIMHDVNEGAIAFLLKNLFEYCVSMKIYSEQDLVDKIKYHDFGFINKKNIPSVVNLQKENLNQNASQILCLFQHLPFILYEKKEHEKIKSVWICVTSLLHIVQVISSATIEENDLVDLERFVDVHLKTFMEIFKKPLRLKQHNMTHYANVIREMGPINQMSMLRFESKHQDMKSRTKGKNFVNLPKTICENHQEYMSTRKNTYQDHISHGSQAELCRIFKNEKKDLLERYIYYDNNEIYETKTIEYNSFKYRKDLFINKNNFMYKIEKILLVNSDIYFYCKQFEFVSFMEFLNSIEISQSQPNLEELLLFGSLKNKKVYEASLLCGKLYIILDSLDLKSMYIS